MESYRLKNIILLILVLLNLFLLGSLSSRHSQQTSAREIALEQMTALYADKGLTLDPGIIPRDRADAVLTLNRDNQQDQALATFFLGADLSIVDDGGGIVRYESTLGSAVFSSGGEFSIELALTPRSIEDFCQDLCREFSYAELDFSNLAEGSGTVTALQYFDERPVVECTISLHFSKGTLAAVSGQHLPSSSVSVREQPCIDALTALSAFLEYRDEGGISCTAVTSLTLGYKAQSIPATHAALSLTPVWRLRTAPEGLEFYVNCTSREVSTS